jgi:DNA-binding HxlR family transcriptional regulator
MPDSVKSKLDNEREMENSDYLINMALHKRRFSDILNDIEGISNRMLSKELKELEINQLVKRTVLDTQAITVQYELTEHGDTLQTIISNLTDWGIVHRKKIVGK